MTARLFVQGMFRSGTTLLARMLATHPDIAFASDPFPQVYKAFRNAVAHSLDGFEGFDPDAPLGDYYFDERQQRLHRAIGATRLDLPTHGVDLDGLRAAIAARCRLFSPRIAPHLDALRGGTFRALVDSGLGIVRTAYGDPRSRVVGTKEVWTGEFAAHLLDAFDDAKVICIVRDPRAVAASNNVGKAKYPWLFLARQWRKLAALAWVLAERSPAHAGRVKVIRYEDLIREPERRIGELCDFIGVALHRDLLDPATYRDGDRARWSQNTSYGAPRQGFDTASMERWKTVLDAREVRFVEALCHAEMALFGYLPERFRPGDVSVDWALHPPRVAAPELSDWIRPYSPGPDALLREAALEALRVRLLVGDDPVGEPDKRRFCLSAALFDRIREGRRR